mmetsp:Transcript_22903/g.58428  ORF Transcript_22903/g.58428 Transcript_22903/m.58428 type:complete len:242 (-) Transcript_22903:331-1056(-)
MAQLPEAGPEPSGHAAHDGQAATHPPTAAAADAEPAGQDQGAGEGTAGSVEPRRFPQGWGRGSGAVAAGGACVSRAHAPGRPLHPALVLRQAGTHIHMTQQPGRCVSLTKARRWSERGIVWLVAHGRSNCSSGGRRRAQRAASRRVAEELLGRNAPVMHCTALHRLIYGGLGTLLVKQGGEGGEGWGWLAKGLLSEHARRRRLCGLLPWQTEAGHGPVHYGRGRGRQHRQATLCAVRFCGA